MIFCRLTCSSCPISVLQLRRSEFMPNSPLIPARDGDHIRVEITKTSVKINYLRDPAFSFRQNQDARFAVPSIKNCCRDLPGFAGISANLKTPFLGFLDRSLRLLIGSRCGFFGGIQPVICGNFCLLHRNCSAASFSFFSVTSRYACRVRLRSNPTRAKFFPL